MKTLCFYDFEATSVARDCDPISLGIIAVQNNKIVSTWYSEFTDFNSDKADQWVKDEIIANLEYKQCKCFPPMQFSSGTYMGNSDYISTHLKEWLSQFEEVEFWADFDVIDKPLLIDLISDWNTQRITVADPIDSELAVTWDFEMKLGLPKHLDNVPYYAFYDIHTLIKQEGFNPNIDRKELAIETITEHKMYDKEMAELNIPESKHYALYDAYLNWKCYEKLNS